MKPLNLQGIGLTSRRSRDRLVTHLRDSGIADEAVLDVMATVPRHIFVDEALAHRAYDDKALPIGHGQTISQPYVVARMTAALLGSLKRTGREPGRVLEIGTGSGYQTAVLSALAGEVFSVERIRGLMERARTRLRAMGVRNVRLRHDDGNLGWPGEAPFDAVLVTAGASHVPDALMEQLHDQSPLVIPVGRGDVKQLKLLERDGDVWQQKTLDDVRFVPLLQGVGR